MDIAGKKALVLGGDFGNRPRRSPHAAGEGRRGHRHEPQHD